MRATDYFTLAEASQMLPGKPDRTTVWRWCREGIKGTSGNRIKLRFTKLGGRFYVRNCDVKAFMQELAEDVKTLPRHDGVALRSMEMPATTAKSRRRLRLTAECEAEALGI